MALYHHSTVVGRTPAELFGLLNDADFLNAHMPRDAYAETGSTEPWVRVDEDETTLSWGSGGQLPGSLDVLAATESSRALLIVRVESPDNVSERLAGAVDQIRRIAESSGHRQAA